MTSRLGLNRLANDLSNDPRLLQAFSTGKGQEMREAYGVEAGGFEALVGRDLATLQRLGVHPLIILKFAIASGMELETARAALGEG